MCDHKENVLDLNKCKNSKLYEWKEEMNHWVLVQSTAAHQYHHLSCLVLVSDNLKVFLAL